jgi:hypothetical protein
MLTSCPNCQSNWGFEEIDWQECDCCGYPNCEDEPTRDEKHCVNCQKEIEIAEDQEEVKSKNAIPAYRWIDDDDVYVGGICWECADKLCNEGKISIGMGSCTVPDAYFM